MGFIFAPNGAFLGRGLGSKTVLGSTHMYYQVSYLFDWQNLFFKTFWKFFEDRPTDRPTKPPLKATSRRLKRGERNAYGYDVMWNIVTLEPIQLKWSVGLLDGARLVPNEFYIID